MNVLNKITWLVIACGLFTSSSCITAVSPKVEVAPKHFLIELPLLLDGNGFLIATSWGAEKTKQNLYLDNHSPTWANNMVIQGNKSISKSKEFLYKTTTAEGNTIEGDVYTCDSIGIANLIFRDVPFYNISNATNKNKTDGVIGENIMRAGVWKFDLKNLLITFASSIDSIKNLQEARKLLAVFNEEAIAIEIQFSNHVSETLELDLGYNGSIILPLKNFENIFEGNKKLYKEPKRFSTPSGTDTIENTMITDSIRNGGKYFETLISTNDLVKEKLIGWRFFSQFEFFVIDFPGKKIYLSQNRLVR